MKFGSKSWRNGEDDFRIEVTPLIDMMFQFLVFFLLTTTFVTNAGIDVDLPHAKTSQKNMQAHDIIVGIDAKGEIVYNQEVVSMESLRGILESEYSKRPNVTVIVQADESVPHGKVVQVMDTIRESGFSKIAIATIAE